MIELALTLVLLAPSDDGALPRAVKLSISSPQARSAPGDPVFQATRILEVELEAEFKQRLSGDHRLDFHVYTPKGKLYQVFTVPFSGRGGPARPRRVDGYPRPLAERGMKAAGRDKYVVSTRMPVAGTWIVTHSLYGRWRVEGFMDGAPVGEKTFSIAP